MTKITYERFEKLVKKGIAAIPEKLLKKLDNVEIIIQDEPTAYQLGKLRVRKNSLILGLYEGVPQTERWNYAQVLPDKITIFKHSIQKIANSEKEIEQIIKDTVWHEIAHHFGMNEEAVRKSEVRRKSKT